MRQNDPLKSVENIVQLPSSRRAQALPTMPIARVQPTPPVMFEAWVNQRDRACAALLGGTKRLLLTGPAGTGKTVLIEHIARVLRAAGRTVIIHLADADPAPPDAGVTLFVDEADRLSAAKLRQLFDGSAGTVVLTGLTSLVGRVAAGTAQFTLVPLDRAAAQDYIAQWLALNGRTPADLDSKAVRALVELSGGVPRLLSTLLSAGSWLAKSNGFSITQEAHIREAAELRSVLVPPTPEAAAVASAPAWRGRVMWSGLLAAVVLSGAAVAILPRLFPTETEQAIASAMPFVETADRWLRGEPNATPPRPVQAAPVAAAVAAAAAAVPPAPVVEPPAAPEPPKPVAALPVPAAPELPPAPPPEPEAQPEPAPVPVQAAPEIKPPDVTPHDVAAPAAPVALPASPAVAAPSLNLPVETIEFLLRRGREMLALEDISAARLLFQRAAEAGSAEAMFELGQSYDPAVLTSIGTAPLADRAEALRWYRRAAAEGDRTAQRLISKP